MEALLNYIKECYQPRDGTEFITLPDGASLDTINTAYDSLVENGIIACNTRAVAKVGEYVQIGDLLILKKITRNLEWLRESEPESGNGDGTFAFVETFEPLYRRLRVNNYSPESVNHTFIISTFIKEYARVLGNKPSYVEYGVRDGKNLFAIAPLVEVAHGIDLDTIQDSAHNNIIRHKMSTDDFSITILPTIKYQVAFIDANHESNAVVRDFSHIINHIDIGGYVFLHDTYPAEQWLLQPSMCNDCYKAPIRIKKLYGEEISILTFPLNPGLTVIRRL